MTLLSALLVLLSGLLLLAIFVLRRTQSERDALVKQLATQRAHFERMERLANIGS